jgi:hypothetical protein
MILLPRYFSSQPQTPVYAVPQAGIAYNSATRIDAVNSASACVGNPARRVTNFGFSDVLDTSGKYVDIKPLSPVFITPFCLAIYFKLPGAVNNNGTILTLLGTAGLNNRIDLYFIAGGAIKLDYYSSTGSATAFDSGAGSISAGESYVVALVNNNGTLQLYINGVIKGSASAPTRDGEASVLKFGGSGAGAVPNIDLAGIFLTRGASGFANLINSPWGLFKNQPLKLFNVSETPVTPVYEFQSFSRGVGRGIARGIA